MRRIFTLLSLLLAVSLVAVACGETKDTGFPPAPETEDAGDGHGGEGGGGPEFDAEPDPQTEPGTELTIQAKNIQFNRDEMLFVADTTINLSFENLDASIDHNVAIYSDDGPGDELFKGEIFPGVETVVYQIPPLEAGEYYFQCDVHPNMNGAVTYS